MQILIHYSLPCSQALVVFELQEYLEMQRQLAIQRLQEQEKERQMRLEQQKHTIQMRAQMPAFSLPYAQVHISCSDFAIEIKRGFRHHMYFINLWKQVSDDVCMCCYADAVFAPQCGRRGGVPAWCSTQLPRHLQPCWFCGGFTYAQHLYESTRAECTTTVPGHARCCYR